MVAAHWQASVLVVCVALSLSWQVLVLLRVEACCAHRPLNCSCYLAVVGQNCSDWKNGSTTLLKSTYAFAYVLTGFYFLLFLLFFIFRNALAKLSLDGRPAAAHAAAPEAAPPVPPAPTEPIAAKPEPASVPTEVKEGVKEEDRKVVVGSTPAVVRDVDGKPVAAEEFESAESSAEVGSSKDKTPEAKTPEDKTPDATADYA
jgi:hypothetical protein